MANISSQANACGRLFVVAAEHRTCSGVDMDTAVTISLVSWDDFSVHSFAKKLRNSSPLKASASWSRCLMVRKEILQSIDGALACASSANNFRRSALGGLDNTRKILLEGFTYTYTVGVGSNILPDTLDIFPNKNRVDSTNYTCFISELI